MSSDDSPCFSPYLDDDYFDYEDEDDYFYPKEDDDFDEEYGSAYDDRDDSDDEGHPAVFSPSCWSLETDNIGDPSTFVVQGFSKNYLQVELW